MWEETSTRTQRNSCSSILLFKCYVWIYRHEDKQGQAGRHRAEIWRDNGGPAGCAAPSKTTGLQYKYLVHYNLEILFIHQAAHPAEQRLVGGKTAPEGVGKI